LSRWYKGDALRAEESGLVLESKREVLYPLNETTNTKGSSGKKRGEWVQTLGGVGRFLKAGSNSNYVEEQGGGGRETF